MFEWLFKYPATVYRQAELHFGTSLGLEWWAVLGLAVGALLATSVLRGRRLAHWPLPRRCVVVGLQAAALAVILVLLADPTLLVRQLKPGANTVAVLLDDSASMALDAGNGASRASIARRLAEREVVPALEERSKVVLFRFGAGARRMESLDALTGAEDRTRLVQSLADATGAFAAEALAAVIVLTDGADNAGSAGSALDLAGLAGVPVHAVGIGPERIAGDVELAAVAMPPVVPPDSTVTARLSLRHAAVGDVRVRVREGEAVLATTTVPLGRGGVATADVELPSGATGVRELSFEIEAPPGDSLPRNDARRLLLEVGERRHRVLYLEGEPRWEYKFLRRAAEADDVLEVVSWLRTTPRKTYRQGVSSGAELEKGFPASRAALYAFDVVVLGSLPATALGDEHHAWLESFVARRGGSLLALAGRNALADGGWDVVPIARALPVALERGGEPSYRAMEGVARPVPGRAGSPLARIGVGESDGWAGLPRLADHQWLGTPKPGASVLLEWVGEGTVAPLLVEQPYGFGRTAVLATATTWRWRMRTPPDDPRHGLFWRQLLRHLAQAAQPRDHVIVEGGPDVLTVGAAFRDEAFEPMPETNVVAQVTGPDGATFEAALAGPDDAGLYTGAWQPGDPGVYRVDVTARAGASERTVTRFATVGADDVEFFDAALNRALLERIATSTGGRYWEPDAVAGIAEAVALHGAGVREQRALPLWDAPFFYLLIVLLKCVEWSLRRWWGSV